MYRRNESDISDDANISNDLNADSLALAEMIMELENAFNIQISDEVAETLKTPSNVIKFIEEKINSSKESSTVSEG